MPTPPATEPAASPALLRGRRRRRPAAHRVLRGSLRLLRDALTGAGTADRYYPPPRSVGGRDRGAGSERPASPATSSFADRAEGGSTRSARAASVATAAADRSGRSVGGSAAKKKRGRAGEIRASVGDAWNRFAGSDSESGSGGKAEGSEGAKGEAGKGAPPPLLREDGPGGGSGAGAAERHAPRDLPLDSPEKGPEADPSAKARTCIPASVRPSDPSLLSPISSSPSVPLYPLLFLLLLCHLAARGLFGYRNRTKLQRKLRGIVGSKRFGVSQEELTRHLNFMKERNGKGKRGEGGDDGRGDESRNGRGSGGDAVRRFEDEKGELARRRRLLLRDRERDRDEEEVLSSENKLLLEVSKEEEEERRRVVGEKRRSEESAEATRSERVGAEEEAKGLAEELTRARKEKESLRRALESKRRAHDDAVARIAALNSKVTEVEAKVADLTNENIILNNVIARLEEENNEMEKVIDEACRSGNGDVDIEEIDVAVVSSYSAVSEAESLTRDDEESIDSQELKRKEEENAKLREERKQLQAEVDDLHEVLLKARKELGRTNGAEGGSDEMRAGIPHAREGPTVNDAKFDELKQLLAKTQTDLEKMTAENQVMSSDLSTIRSERDQLKVRQTSSLQQAKKMSDLESRAEELQQLLSRKQSDLEKNRSESEGIASDLARVQEERDALQKELAMAQRRAGDQSADQHAALESMQKKNERLQNSLTDIESLYSSLRQEKFSLEKSFEVTSTRFKSLVAEKESLQKSARKDRKRVAECNVSLEEALKFTSSLIAELEAEMRRASGSPSPASKGTEPSEAVVSRETSDCKVLVQNTEALLQKLMDLKRAKQQLLVAVEQLVMDVIVKPDLAQEYCTIADRIHGAGDDSAGAVVDGECVAGVASSSHVNSPVSKESLDSSLSQPSQLSDTKESASSVTPSDDTMIHQMLDRAKRTNRLSKNGKLDPDLRRLATNLENEAKGRAKQGRDSSISPSTVPLMKRLWRKNSAPYKTGK